MINKIIFFFLLFFTFLSFSQTEKPNDPCPITVSKTLVKNNDDRLTVDISCPIESFHFQLYTRWGEVLYETDSYLSPLNFDINETTKQKKRSPERPKYVPGTYYWKVTVIDAESLNTFEKTGYLQII